MWLRGVAGNDGNRQGRRQLADSPTDMDVATLLGFVSGVGILLYSIVAGSPLSSFINGPGLLIVVGGTVAATFISESMSAVLGGFKVGLKAFFNKPPKLEDTIKKITELAVVVRREGLLALENQQVEHEFLAKGVRLAVDGVAPEEIQLAMRSELISLKARHKRGQKMLKFMAATAPSMGMVGTLIGLVQMLQALDDPSAIGPAMAVALLTTLYGAVMAFLIFGPMAQKLEHRSAEEAANMSVILAGLDSLVKGENARLVQEKLQGHLAPKARSADEG